MRMWGRLSATVAAGAAVVTGALISVGPGVGNAGATTTSTISTGCQLGNGISHVIEITFDNVHFNRDNPNVLSDLEQMPALQNFITGQGTLLSNSHTPLIAHTADDTLTNYTGLYGDRQGLGISNSYEVYQPGGSVSSQSAFSYWTGTFGADAYPNMAYSASVPASGQPPATPPAPWVPFTRAGCDFGAVSTSNMELENTNPDLANVFGSKSPEVAQYNADKDSFKDQETNDYVGLAVHCAKSDSFCTTAQAQKFGETGTSSTAAADVLPDEPGGYNGFQAVFGHKYLQPQLAQAANGPSGVRTVNGSTYQVTDAGGNLVDLNGKELDGQYTHTPGFPGFGPISAAQSLAYVADMQEVGVPVTYAYISDAHEKKPGQSGCSNPGTAQGPGDPCYQATLAAYNQAFATFFGRLGNDGINASNTLFVFTADEGDHFSGANVGRAASPTCSGTPGTSGYTCSYAGKIGEQQVDIHGLLAAQQGVTTGFYNEPQGNAVYITGNPGPDSPDTRQLERAFASATAKDQWDGATENVAQYEADPTVEQLLHFADADPNRTPSFTVFPKPDFYLQSGTTDKCATGTTAANAAANCSSTNDFYAWDHGYYAPEINNTWLGLVGPGVAHRGIDGSSAAQGPSSAGAANANPSLDTQVANPGTWADHTDIRPTIMADSGLKDDYITDGRVLVEDLTVHPGATADDRFLPLAQCYKQLNSSVGRFGTDVLVADTSALASGSAAGDSTYQEMSATLAALGAHRDRLAAKIKDALAQAEFAGQEVPDAQGLIAQCGAVLDQADALAGQTGGA
ncbi:MAG: hypothetical protein JO337_00260 [Acidimicrobiales bacterium]|nr:hypothetical protein [Acidimicrobiales bacterium]